MASLFDQRSLKISLLPGLVLLCWGPRVEAGVVGVVPQHSPRGGLVLVGFRVTPLGFQQGALPPPFAFTGSTLGCRCPWQGSEGGGYQGDTPLRVAWPQLVGCHLWSPCSWKQVRSPAAGAFLASLG